jgi:hypothetical protein
MSQLLGWAQVPLSIAPNTVVGGCHALDGVHCLWTQAFDLPTVLVCGLQVLVGLKGSQSAG